MTDTIKRIMERMIDHYVLVCLFLALFIMTLIGVGNVTIIGMLGVILCIVGMAQPSSAKADLWILVPLIVYNLLSLASSYGTHGNIVVGFASTQMIFPVIYLLMAYLDGKELGILKRLAALWTATVAAIGVGQFVFRALSGGSSRLGGLLGNPNALGIFLVLGWFALMGTEPSCEEREKGCAGYWKCLEPIILTALALTLSMGSFVAMAVGIVALLVQKKQYAPFKETVFFGSCLLARAGFGIGMGILLYLAADRTDVPWICILLLIYIVLAALNWPEYCRFLERYRRMPVLISGCGLLVAAAAVLVRPSSFATFAERLEMMRNGLKYLTVNPLLGVGPYQWRILNLYDGDKYFNTYHIHNAFIHVGVELGLVALGMLLIVTVRCFMKKKDAALQAGCTAFLFHSLMDTGFFYMGIFSLAMITAAQPAEKGKKIGAAAARSIFGVLGVLFAYNLIWYARVT